jgi:NitT/TauT family transport system substrate-binding protein
VAVNVLSGGTVAAANAGIEAAGGDPSKIKYVEVPSPQQVDAVEKGTVDAAVALEPFVTLGLDKGMHLIQRPQVAGVAGMPSVAVATSAKYAQEHPDVVRHFVAAVAEANRYANANLDKTRAISTYTGLDAALLARINLPMWSDDPTEWDNLDAFVELLVKQGILSKEPDLAAAIVK